MQPNRWDERARIDACGGRVIFAHGPHPCEGSLAMSRVICNMISPFERLYFSLRKLALELVLHFIFPLHRYHFLITMKHQNWKYKKNIIKWQSINRRHSLPGNKLCLQQFDRTVILYEENNKLFLDTYGLLKAATQLSNFCPFTIKKDLISSSIVFPIHIFP